MSTTLLAATLCVLGIFMYIQAFTNSVALLGGAEALPEWVRRITLIRPGEAPKGRGSLFTGSLALLGALAPQIVVVVVLVVRASDFDLVGITLLVVELAVVAVWTLFVLASFRTRRAGA